MRVAALGGSGMEVFTDESATLALNEPPTAEIGAQLRKVSGLLAALGSGASAQQHAVRQEALGFSPSCFGQAAGSGRRPCV